MVRLLFLLGVCCAAAWGQLVAPDKPVPKTGKPPVVFVNGYQNDCAGSSFANTFGIADQVLQNNGLVSLFFDNCTAPGKPDIETLGAALRHFLLGLKFTDGTDVDTVDVVAHSMGGLIVRAYLSGKQSGVERTFAPPPDTRIRRAVFLATPHFGTILPSLIPFFSNSQLDELGSGSHFLYDLNTWNDNTDDLRGIEAIAAVGNAGTGKALQSGLGQSGAGLDDGVVAVTSASLGFYLPGRTRVLPLCHVDPGGLVTAFDLCPADTKGIAAIKSATDENARLIVSFLNGNDEWRSIGRPVEELLSTGGAVYVRPFTASGSPEKLNSATLAQSSTTTTLKKSNDEIGWTDLFPAGQSTLTADTGSTGVLTRTTSIRAATGQAFAVKPGPTIDRVLPAAAPAFPLTFAPRTIVAIYGVTLAPSTEQAQAFPLPDTLGGAQVKLNGTALPLYYASAGQINAVLPGGVESGPISLTVETSAGSHSVNLMMEAAHPSIFTADGSGSGLASALRYRNGPVGVVVNLSEPVTAGDYLSLYLTGLGATTRTGDLDYAVQQPTVTIGGMDCPVSFAGGSPVYVGLDQINCQVPAGLPADMATPVVVTSGSRTSNTATVPVQ